MKEVCHGNLCVLSFPARFSPMSTDFIGPPRRDVQKSPPNQAHLLPVDVLDARGTTLFRVGEFVTVKVKVTKKKPDSGCAGCEPYCLPVDVSSGL
jgi:hypothetical protein